MMTRHLVVVAVLTEFLLVAAVVVLTVVRERERGRPGVLLDIVPPEGTTADLQTWSKFYRKLFGISYSPLKRLLFGQPSVVFELWSKEGDLGARCWAPARRAGIVTTLLRAAVPGALLQKSTAAVELEGFAARARFRLDADPLHALDDPQPEALRSVVQALAEAPSGLIQVVVSPDENWQKRALRKLDVLAGLPPEHGLLTSALRWVLDGAFHLILAERSAPAAPPARHSRPLPPPTKAAVPGYRAEIRLRVGAASTGEAKASIDALVAAFRGFDSIANGLRPSRVWFGRRFDKAIASRSGPAGNMILVQNELAGLFHLPVGLPGFEGAPPRLAPAKRPSPEGNIVCQLEDERQTAIRIAPNDALHHMQVVGPTGVGKTTLLMNLALGDIEAGRGIAVIDPKGDLVRDLLERIPRRNFDRVVLIDPSLRDQPVGLNLLECDDPDQHEVVCDQLVTIFRKTYERFWGPRTDDLLRAAVLTLLRRPDSSLCEVPLLLLQANARKVLIAGLRDPVGLQPYWYEWDQKTDAQRLQEAGPVLNKLRSVLLRPTVRNIMGQSRSTIDLAGCMNNGGILLVSLAKGLLGEDTSRLLGSFLVARMWQTAMKRAGQPAADRRDFMLYLDEFQDYLHLPQNLDDVLVAARGYHLGLVLAHQHLGQLSDSTRETLAANARTRVVFQCSPDDARSLTREFSPWLSAEQLLNLQRYRIAVRLFREGRTERPFTGITPPAPPSLGADHAADLVASALKRCGRPRVEVEREIEDRLGAYGAEASPRYELATTEEQNPKRGRSGGRSEGRRSR